MSSPYWLHRTPRETLRVDVAIVGAGICGISAAREVQRRGLSCAVLERGRAGSGASSRNAGFLMRGCADNYAAACRQYGRDQARTLWRWTEENLAMLRAAGAGDLPSFSSRPSCVLALSKEELGEIEESVDLLRADGFEAKRLEFHDDDAWRRGLALGGLLNPDDAVVNPAELVHWLAEPVRPLIHEEGEVIALRPGSNGVEIQTARLDVLAGRVLIATNAHGTGLIPELSGVITPNRGQMLALHAPGVRLDFAYYANHGSEYFRSAEAGVVVVGGCRTSMAASERTCEAEPSEPVQSAIEAFARELLGQDLRVVSRWAGIMGFSPDGLPLVGPVREGVWFCGGFTGHGMSMAHRTAVAAVGEILGESPTPFPLSRVPPDR